MIRYGKEAQTDAYRRGRPRGDVDRPRCLSWPV